MQTLPKSRIEIGVQSYLRLLKFSKGSDFAAISVVLFVQVVPARDTTGGRCGSTSSCCGCSSGSRLEGAPVRSPLQREPHGPITDGGRRGRRQLAAPDLAVPKRHGQMANGVLHGPADGGPNLHASLAEPPADVDDGGDGCGREEVLPVALAVAAAGPERDDGEVDLEGHPLVRHRRPWELRRRLEQTREPLREAVRDVLAVPLHPLPRLERDLHAREPIRRPGIPFPFVSPSGVPSNWNRISPRRGGRWRRTEEWGKGEKGWGQRVIIIELVAGEEEGGRWG